MVDCDAVKLGSQFTDSAGPGDDFGALPAREKFLCAVLVGQKSDDSAENAGFAAGKNSAERAAQIRCKVFATQLVWVLITHGFYRHSSVPIACRKSVWLVALRATEQRRFGRYGGDSNRVRIAAESACRTTTEQIFLKRTL